MFIDHFFFTNKFVFVTKKAFGSFLPPGPSLFAENRAANGVAATKEKLNSKLVTLKFTASSSKIFMRAVISVRF